MMKNDEENEDNYEDFWGFCKHYKGAIIGGLVAILIACTGLWKLLIILALIAGGFWVGNYVQRNKEKVKEILRKFIDKF